MSAIRSEWIYREPKKRLVLLNKNLILNVLLEASLYATLLEQNMEINREERVWMSSDEENAKVLINFIL